MIERIKNAVTSKKFFCLMIAVAMTWAGKMTSTDLVIVMSIYIGINVAQKYIENK